MQIFTDTEFRWISSDPRQLEGFADDGAELPDLPETTMIVSVSGIKLRGIQNLPISLVDLYCEACGILELPELPPGLKRLCVVGNPGIRTIPELPVTLTRMFLRKCSIESLPPLPDSLVSLDVCYNMIRTIRRLPPRLEVMLCENNRLECLPEIPPRLTYLSAINNRMREVPRPYKNIKHLYLHGNYLVEILDRWDSVYNFSYSIKLLGQEYCVSFGTHRIDKHVELRRHYLVVIGLIRYLEFTLKIPVELARLLFSKFLVAGDIRRISG